MNRSYAKARNTMLGLFIAAGALFASACADVESASGSGDDSSGVDQAADVAVVEQALGSTFTVSFPQNWGLRAEGATPPRNDFRFVPYCTNMTCRYAQGTTVRVTLGGGISTSITCGTASGRRLSGPYVMIYNLSANWNCTRAY
ncbi:MAG: hypothetical protein RL385_670 [Pseudomonadota bacterium]